MLEESKIEKAIQLWMIQHGKKFACAESCTGGSLASQLTAIPGASAYFVGSIVSYSNEMKEKILQVPLETLQQHGAVSRETVLKMWEGVLKITGADFGVAVTGIAGPLGGTQEKPVGTVYYAMGFRDKTPTSGKFQFKGSRAAIILQTTRSILGLIVNQLH